jgi:hypothetical protein
MNNCESYWLVGKAMGQAMIELLLQVHAQSNSTAAAAAAAVNGHPPLPVIPKRKGPAAEKEEREQQGMLRVS